MHKRTSIRDRIIVVLTGLTTTGANVFQSKIEGLSDAQLPALKVYCKDEELIDDTFSKGHSGIMSMELMIECIVKENTNYDDTLDLILEEIQAAMTTERASGTLPTLAIDFYYSGLQEVEYEVGEKDRGNQTIVYRIEYEQAL